MFVRARTTFITPGRVRIREGSILRADDPVVVARAALFEPVDDAAPVESATARPGERRNTRRRSTSKPAEG